MSADNSGGVRSSVTRIASTIAKTVSASASRTSSLEIFMTFGTPPAKSRPRTSTTFSESSGYAEPSVFLMISAVLTPISRLYFRLIY